MGGTTRLGPEGADEVDSPRWLVAIRQRLVMAITAGHHFTVLFARGAIGDSKSPSSRVDTPITRCPEGEAVFPARCQPVGETCSCVTFAVTPICRAGLTLHQWRIRCEARCRADG